MRHRSLEGLHSAKKYRRGEAAECRDWRRRSQESRTCAAQGRGGADAQERCGRISRR